MARYYVAFDGKWQEVFDHERDALEWAQEVASLGGRIVYVIKNRWTWQRLIAVFPREREREGRILWSTRAGAGDAGGAAVGG